MPGARKVDGGSDALPPSGFDQGLMRMPNTTTADCPGASVPIVAVIEPAAPFAGVTIDPCDVVAPPALENTVFDGVAQAMQRAHARITAP